MIPYCTDPAEPSSLGHKKPQMRQAFTAVPSFRLFIFFFQRASQKVPELSRTVAQVSKKSTTQLEAALACHRAQGFVPLPLREGGATGAPVLTTLVTEQVQRL